MEITSRDNQHIKYYRKLMTDKKFRQQEHLFCLEGVRLIEDAFRCGFPPERIYATDKCLQKYNVQLKNILESCDIITVSEPVAEKLSDVRSPQGIFGLVKKLDKIADADTIIKNSGNYIGLCSIQDPGNMGTMIRTAEAFGIDGIVLHQTCDIYSPKVVRATMGSLFRTAFMQCEDLTELIRRINSLGGKTLAAVVDRHSKSITDCDFTGTNLLLIGNEANGLPQQVTEQSSETVTIPMAGNAESLNAAVAASVCIWEMTRRR